MLIRWGPRRGGSECVPPGLIGSNEETTAPKLGCSMRPKITTRCDGESLVVDLSGAIDGRAAAELRGRLLHLIDGTDCSQVTIDLSDVKLLKLDGVNLLQAAYWRATGEGATFDVVAPHHPVRSVLMLASIDWLMPVHASLREAREEAVAEHLDAELAAH